MIIAGAFLAIATFLAFEHLAGNSSHKVIILIALSFAIAFWPSDDMMTCQEQHSFDTCAHALWR